MSEQIFDTQEQEIQETILEALEVEGTVTDEMIGSRTIIDNAAPITSTNTITNLLSGLAFILRNATGKSQWLSRPSLSLEAANSKLNTLETRANTFTNFMNRPAGFASATAVDFAEQTGNKNAPNGYAGLDDNGKLASSLLLNAYPIGSIYLSALATNPGDLFGGEWVSWGAGRVPVGLETNDADFATVEKTGGSKELQSHTHGLTLNSASISHTHSMAHNHTLAHTHTVTHNHTGTTGNESSDHRHFVNANVWVYRGVSSTEGTHNVPKTGNSALSGLNNLFTGRNDAKHTHSFTTSTNTPTTSGASVSTTGGASSANTGNSAPAHTHTGTANSSSTGNAKNLQPYIVCYMWKRTA